MSAGGEPREEDGEPREEDGEPREEDGEPREGDGEQESMDGLLRRVAFAPPVPPRAVERRATLPALLGGRYKPIRFVAAGGMGRIYEVEHAGTGERLALKLLAPTLAAAGMAPRLEREARATARLGSEHVVRVKEAGVAPELDGAPFLVMELLRGMSLEQAAARPVRPAQVVGWLAQVAEAVDEAHAAGIVHRDLKPDNLFLAERAGATPIVKVLDFGIAKVLEDMAAPTSAGQLLGTPRYMAPEQVARGGPITPACDRFALGLIAYRLLAGESYRRGSTRQALAEALRATLEPPSRRYPELGPGFDAWFAQACHPDPALRFASAAALVEGLGAALGT